MVQTYETISIDPADPQNPYVTIRNCTMTILISAPNNDLRDGINTRHVFFQGVPVEIAVAVRCGDKAVTLVIALLDA
jgi:hypothetical protein